MLLKLSPMESGRPGQALLRIIGWSDATTQLELTILSNQGNVYLQHPDTGATLWSSNPFWFRLDALIPDGDDFYIPVGAAVVDPLLSTTNARYQVNLREVGSGTSQQANLKVEGGIRLSEAGGQTESLHAFGALPSAPLGQAPAPVAIEEEIVPEVIVHSSPVSEPKAAVVDPGPVSGSTSNSSGSKKSGKLLPILIAAVALALALAAGAYWWLNRAPSMPDAPAPTPAPLAQPSGCAADAMAAQGELEFVQACIKQNPDTDTVLATIAAAIEAGNCGVAQRLYANRGGGGDARIALAYAHEYDPRSHQANKCFKEPDPATAAYWYDAVLSADPEHAEARQRFEELSK